MARKPDEERDGVALTNLDQPLFDGAGATKRDLIDYLDAVRDRMLPVLRGRPLSVVRVVRGQEPFMQKNVPKYTPAFVKTVKVWAEASHREVSYALCDDRRTLLWFGNQRAIEYHPQLYVAGAWDRPTHMVLDLDPPEGAPFSVAVAAARLIRQVLTEVGMDGAAATRAVAARAERLDPDLATTAFIREDREGKVFLDATRAGGATVVAAYSPRVRPGTPVSFPLAWDDLDDVTPADFTVLTAPGLLPAAAPGRLEPMALDEGLVAEGHSIPVARLSALQHGRERKRRERQGGDLRSE
jgi:bifunctional non-homologous end joining protein LigD